MRSGLNEIAQGQRNVSIYAWCSDVKPGPIAFGGPAKVEIVSMRRKKKSWPRLLSQFELLCNRLITADIGCVEVIQQTPALSYHHQQAPSGAVIFFVFLQMLGQVVDALRE